MKIKIRRYSKIKKRYLVGIIVIIVFIIGGMGGKTYMDNKEEKEDQQLIEWEKVAAQKMKNNFANVKTIKFNKDSIYKNKMSGYTRINVDIVTTRNQKLNIDTSLPYQKDLDEVGSYVGDLPEKGKTITKVEVIYSNNEKEVLENDK